MGSVSVKASISLLAERIVAGEVVFFIGSGYSSDSERNTAKRFARRLLARLIALLHTLRVEGGESDIIEDVAQGLDSVLGVVGNLDNPESYMNAGNINKLATDYYAANDWMISAFQRVMTSVKLSAILPKLATLEDNLLARTILDENGNAWPCESVKLDRLDPGIPGGSHLKDREQAKALFLDTIGFRNRGMMAGEPMASESELVAKSFKGRLRPRHHVLGWLAREGLCPFLLTTNFDLLLEGGFRLSGFTPRELAAEKPEFLPPTTLRSFCRIAGAQDFLDFGHAHRSALLVKIHGCAEEYSKSFELSASQVAKYLNAVVFTYREIQNWRQDAWSRDFLRTLLRTRTLVFCGYSGIDPVIHDTFRTVYEEMARQRDDLVKRSELPKARAFFFGNSKRREFHGMEILRAASRAAGADTQSLTAHSQYVPFYFKGEGFPSLDETLLWTFHAVIRKRQAECLQLALRRAVSSLMGHRPVVEIESVIANFTRLCEKEQLCLGEMELLAAELGAGSGSDDTKKMEARSRWQWLTSWTSGFFVYWMRELAMVEGLQRNPGTGLAVEEWRRRPWYYPLADHPEWAAWGVVVELALRRLVAAARGELDAWSSPQAWIRAEPGADAPSILFTTDSKRRLPSRLNIRLRGSLADMPPVGHLVYRDHHWPLEPSGLLWPPSKAGSSGGIKVRLPPSAEQLLRWAASGSEIEATAKNDIRAVFGEGV